VMLFSTGHVPDPSSSSHENGFHIGSFKDLFFLCNGFHVAGIITKKDLDLNRSSRYSLNLSFYCHIVMVCLESLKYLQNETVTKCT